MNEITIFNTLTGQKEVMKPLKEGHVSMYNCGPTVYDHAHIGNLRSFVFADTLRRTLELSDYEVKQVINITDVGHLSGDGDEGEDKMTKAILREGKTLNLSSMKEVGDFYTNRFREDLASLNIKMPSEIPKASENIKEDIEIIERLEKNGFTYKTSDGIYFDISKFPKYGMLGNIKIESLKEGARVSINAEKRNPRDFCLWKFNEKIGWMSPWGNGFPGWHIECSAMSRKYLGQPFDIHTGGIDLIPIHHNNEIAQSESAFGIPLARYWMHSAFLKLGESKMAKSDGNLIILKTLIEHSISPLAYRYWLLTAHYRSPISFSYEAVSASQNALIKIITFVGKTVGEGKIIEEYASKFKAFVNDDLDTPKAIALIWDMLKDTDISDVDKKSTLLYFDKVLGLNLDAAPQVIDEPIPPDVAALASAREDARKAKDWQKADALRQEIINRGYEIEDTPEGIEIYPI